MAPTITSDQSGLHVNFDGSRIELRPNRRVDPRRIPRVDTICIRFAKHTAKVVRVVEGDERGNPGVIPRGFHALGTVAVHPRATVIDDVDISDAS